MSHEWEMKEGCGNRNSLIPKLQGGVAIGGVAVEAEFVHCCNYAVVDLQVIVCIIFNVRVVSDVTPALS